MAPEQIQLISISPNLGVSDCAIGTGKDIHKQKININTKFNSHTTYVYNGMWLECASYRNTSFVEPDVILLRQFFVRPSNSDQIGFFKYLTNLINQIPII